jgi:hypothetical protein
MRVNTQSNFTALGYNGITEVNSSSGNGLWAGAAPCTLGVAFGGASTGITYGAQSCQYQIEGQKVELQFFIGLSAVGSATGVATLSGLPITPGPASGSFFGTTAPVSGASGIASLTGTILAQPAPASTNVNLVTQGATGTVNLSNTNFTAASMISGQLNYFKQ